MRFVEVPEALRASVPKADPDDVYLPKLLVVNFMLPAYAPSNPLWGGGKYDGESYSVVLYLTISPEATDTIKSGDSNVASLLRVRRLSSCTTPALIVVLRSNSDGSRWISTTPKTLLCEAV
jgi:hypothetical protein